MHSLRLNIEDSVFDKVISFLHNLPKNDVVIIEDKIINNSNIKKEWDSWSEDEIDSVGKIGFISDSFEKDDEDYSKW